jgi:hypothetical protein
MASYDGLTLYTYGTSAQPMLNIGWLGTGSPFPTGDTPPEVIDGLLVLADNQQNIMRGLVIHYILRHRYSPPTPFQAAVLATIKE